MSSLDEMDVCCVCGAPTAAIEHTGGGFDYAFCEDDLARFRAATDEEGWPVAYPRGTYAETAEAWTAEGFTVAPLAEIQEWRAKMDARLRARGGA